MKILLCGGSGFVGQHLYRRLADNRGHTVRIYDKVMPKEGSGFCADIHDLEGLCGAMDGSDMVFHLASNADISKSAEDPTVDFREGTELTQNVLEAMRKTRTRNLVYFSGSGVYGDYPGKEFHEEHGPLLPVSTYGASKLASEALIHAYCSMFGIHARVFRPANIVGPGQTHGVGFDFVRRLKADPTRLRVLGNGYQTKSYVHIEDVLRAIDEVWDADFFFNRSHYEVYNIASADYITVRDIAQIACDAMNVHPVIEYAGGDRGWNGDVPRISFDCAKLHSLGWSPQYTSAQAVYHAIHSML